MNVKLVHSWGLLRGQGSIDFHIVSEQLLDYLKKWWHVELTASVPPRFYEFLAEKPEFYLCQARRAYGTMTAAISLRVPAFVPIQLPDQPEVSPSTSLVRIVSYNILAQSYVKSVSFPHSPSPCLRWKNRSKAVLEKLLSFDADVLCLQELDEYDSYYKSRLSKEGYSSVYIQRSGRKRDGCGIFFKRERMELVEEQAVDFNDLVPTLLDVDKCERRMGCEVSTGTESISVPVEDSSPPKSRSRSRSSSPVKAGAEERGDPNDPRVRLKRDCVAILAAFRIIEAPSKLVILGNTHLYWDPEWADVKLAQAKYLLSRIVKFQHNLRCNVEASPLVLVCGDYNSTPGDRVYKYITSGLHKGYAQHCIVEGNSNLLLEKEFAKLDLHGAPLSDGDNVASKDGNEWQAERAPIPLVSLYGAALGEHPNTNVTPGFTGTLDYIFFCPSDSLRFVRLMPLPTPDSLDLVGGLPNYSHPSDHLPIGADFAIY